LEKEGAGFSRSIVELVRVIQTTASLEYDLSSVAIETTVLIRKKSNNSFQVSQVRGIALPSLKTLRYKSDKNIEVSGKLW